MYYAEEIINGVLCFKTTPDGEWTQFTAEQLTAKLKKANEMITGLINDIAQMNELI